MQVGKGNGNRKEETGPPRVWALLGHRTGDNLQVEALANALGWPWERKRLAWRKRLVGWTPFYGRVASLAPLTPESRAAIAPPWPDLVLAVGWRSVPVERWIGRESGARLVHLGRPRAPLDAFDLVLSTPQYGLPDAPNVIRLDAPLTRLSPKLLEAAADEWCGRFRHLPRPWIAVLIGGDAPPLRLTPEAAADLGAKADALARARDGSLLIATGPRTGQLAADTFLQRIGAPGYSYLWGEAGENPYAGYLALADEFVVTSDSISMAHEASLTAKPVHIFDLPPEPPGLRSALAAALRTARGRAPEWLDRRLRNREGTVGEAYRGFIRNGWLSAPRDAEAFHAGLLRRGRAVRLGSAVGPSTVSPAGSETDRAVAAVRDLIGV